jgi:protein-tyrosine-phosphatase
VARRHDLVLQGQTPRMLDDVLRPGDMIITVCDRAHEELPAVLRGAHWSVADPARSGSAAAFDDALRDLSDRVVRLAPAISPSRSA